MFPNHTFTQAQWQQRYLETRSSVLFALVHLKEYGSANPVAAASAAQTLNTKASGNGAHDISHRLVVSALELGRVIEAFLAGVAAIAWLPERLSKKPIVMPRMPRRSKATVVL